MANVDMVLLPLLDLGRIVGCRPARDLNEGAGIAASLFKPADCRAPWKANGFELRGVPFESAVAVACNARGME
jgi:hypothetical protein